MNINNPKYISSSKHPSEMTRDDKIIFALDKAIDFILSEHDIITHKFSNITIGLKVMIALYDRLKEGKM